MKIIDCFVFYNEIEMLDFRLEYLYNTVNYFVLVEATNTFSGDIKPLFFEQNKQRYSKYMDKIIHIIVNDMPQPEKRKLGFLNIKKITNINYPMLRENFQRNCIDRGIQKLSLKDDDLILISDLDEIPDRNTIKTLQIGDGIYGLLQDFYYYNLTCKNTELWSRSRILNYKIYKLIRKPQDIRFNRLDMSKLISKGGWHLSYFGDSKFIQNKIKSFYHTEYNNIKYTDLKIIEDNIQKGIDLFGRSEETFIKIAIEENDYLPEGFETIHRQSAPI